MQKLLLLLCCLAFNSCQEAAVFKASAERSVSSALQSLISKSSSENKHLSPSTLQIKNTSKKGFLSKMFQQEKIITEQERIDRDLENLNQKKSLQYFSSEASVKEALDNYEFKKTFQD